MMSKPIQRLKQSQASKNNINKQDFHALSFDREFNNNNDDFNQYERDDQIKNQYSTFIEELQQTTEKLINEVFNAEYKPQIDSQSDEENNHNKAIENKYVGKASHKNSKQIPKYGTLSRLFTNQKNQNLSTQSPESFKNFITRNNKWCKRKQQYIQKQVQKKKKQQIRQLRDTPKICRGSIQKLQPIYERALEIHASKEKKRAYQRIQDKKKQDDEINNLPFHPEIISKNKQRSLQEYLRDKQQWERKKKDSIQVKKLKLQAEKYSQCSFKPNLIAKQIDETSIKIKPGQKVQERLLRSLQKVFIEI